MEDGQTNQPGSVSIRIASPQEGERLRQIAISSKSYWGYDLDRVRQWAAVGDWSPQGLRAKEVYVAQVDERLVAWAALIPKGELAWLDDLWVEPEWHGQDIGSRLFSHALERARQLGAKRLECEAEPNAIGFYEKMGAHYLRDGEQTVFGRAIPVMGLDLAPASRAGDFAESL